MQQTFQRLQPSPGKRKSASEPYPIAIRIKKCYNFNTVIGSCPCSTNANISMRFLTLRSTLSSATLTSTSGSTELRTGTGPFLISSRNTDLSCGSSTAQGLAGTASSANWRRSIIPSEDPAARSPSPGVPASGGMPRVGARGASRWVLTKKGFVLGCIQVHPQLPEGCLSWDSFWISRLLLFLFSSSAALQSSSCTGLSWDPSSRGLLLRGGFWIMDEGGTRTSPAFAGSHHGRKAAEECRVQPKRRKEVRV